MGAKAYRLGEYKIMESGTGELRWEAHFGFAQSQEGRCFTKGTILFICPAESDQAGFLKGDFLDHIKAFPAWSKTRHYCRDFEIYSCKTDKRVTKQNMLMWMSSPNTREGANAQREGAFRLGRYEMTRNVTGQIAWKTSIGRNASHKGTCTVIEDILFLGRRGSPESNLNKCRFGENLAQLPQWDQTEYYCPKSSLCNCRSEDSVQQERTTWPRARRETKKHDDTGKAGKPIRFKPTGLDTWKRQALSFSHHAMKSFIYAAEALRLIISFSLSCSIRFRSQIKRMWHLKKGNRPSFHHPEDHM